MFPRRAFLSVVRAIAAVAALGCGTAARAQPTPPAEPGPAGPAPASPAPLSTDARIEQLDQQIRILARQIEMEREAATAAAAAAPAAGAGAGGFELRSADGAFRIRFRGYLHADSRLYGDDDGARGVDHFLLRRARPIVEATTFRLFDVRIMPDFGGGTAALQDAYVDARFARRFNVRFGKTKPPVGQERLASATEMLFIERALPTALVPNRDVGIYAYGDLAPWLAYQSGVFNGVVDGGSADGDVADSKDVIGRLVVTPFRTSTHERLQPLSVGFAVTGGREAGTAAAPGLAQLRSGGQLVWFRYRSDATDAGTTIAAGRRTRFATSGQYYTGPLTLQAEHVVARHDVRRAAAADRLEHRSWQVTGAWFLTGETATGRGVVPRRAFDYARDGWGAWEIVARVNALTLDDDTFPTFANADNSARSATAAGLGLNWYLNRAVKVSADYEVTRFDGGAPSGTDREREHAVFTRFQIAF